MNDVLIEPKAPLMFATVPCKNFFKNSGHFINYNAPKRCRVKTSSNQKTPFNKETRGFLFYFHSIRVIGW